MLKNKRLDLILTMIAIFIATFMTSVETTIVTTAMPTIISKLNGLALQSWVFAMYLLTTAVSTPVYGKLSDQLGRKPIFVSGLIIFLLGSFLSGIAPNIYLLIIFRAIQGFGAGAVMPMTFTIIADLFPYDKRSNIIALNNTGWGISALLGPLIGGFVVDRLNWHWIFFINIPLGIIVLILILIGFDESRKVKDKKANIDYKGTLSLTATLVSLLIFLQLIGETRLSIPLILVMLVILIISTVVLVYSERKSDDPIIPLPLFKNQLFKVQILTTLLLSGVQISFQIYFPIWLQSVYRVSASIAGLAITPSPVLWLPASFLVGILVKKFIPKRIAIPVLIIQMLFYLLLVFASLNFPMIMFYIIAAITGGGLGIIITMNTLISQEVVPENDVGTASSMLTLGRTLGQTVMTGILGLVFNLSINHELVKYPNVPFQQVDRFISSNQNSEASLIPSMQKIIIEGMHNVFLVTVVLFVIVLIVNIRDKNKNIIK